MNSIDVVRFILEGQSETVAKIVLTEAEENWNPKAEGVVFFSFSAIDAVAKETNWAQLFNQIEISLSDAKYTKYADTICTHILEGFSNAVANKSLDAKYLIENAGPLARAYMKAWELTMDGKTIF